MRVKLNLFGLLLGCLLIGCAANAEAQNTRSEEWKRYELGQGNFNVLLPRQPNEQFTPSPPNAPVPVEVYIYSVTLDDGAFVAQYSLFGEAALEWSDGAKGAFYQSVWDGAVEGFNKEMVNKNLEFRAKLVAQRDIKFSGYSGQEIVFTLGPLQGQMWTTLVGRQAFGATVLGSEKLSTADRQKFMESFTLTLKPVPAATRAN